MTERSDDPATTSGTAASAAANGRSAPVESEARPGPRLRRGEHPGPRGPRGRPRGPACTSARPTRAACTTSSARSSTTRSTRRWPATPRRSRSRSRRRHGRRSSDDGRGIPSTCTRPARPPSRSSYRPPRRRQVRRRRLQGLGRPARRRRQRRQRALRVAARRSPPRRQGLAQEYERGKPTRAGQKVGRRATGAGTRTHLPRRSRDLRDDRLRVRDPRPALPRVGLPDQGRLDHVRRRARRPRALVLLRGRHQSFVRHLNRNKRGRCTAARSTSSAARATTVVEVALQYNDGYTEIGLRLRQQHQHHRRRHATSPASARR